ncbi:MAG TPA: response regulator [bacterium]|nr:response regulator [bacterium]HPN30838.1 response regulator [bacterium]
MTDNVDSMNMQIERILKEIEYLDASANPKIQILIVDDSSTARRSIIHKLEDNSLFDFIEANNGIEAFVMLGKHPGIRMIFLDIEMPVLNGKDFYCKGKEAGVLNNIPVIMVTSTSDKKIVVDFLKMGIAAYIVKPYDEQEFLKIVRGVLSAIRKKN